MDPHFPEYIAAVAGMHDLYGEAGDDRPTEFHEVSDAECGDAARVSAPLPVAMPRSMPHWDCEPTEDFASHGAWI